jgi:hypothetical protein
MLLIRADGFATWDNAALQRIVSAKIITKFLIGFTFLTQ